MLSRVLSALRPLLFAFLAGALTASAVLLWLLRPAGVPSPRAAAAICVGLALLLAVCAVVIFVEELDAHARSVAEGLDA